MKKISIALVDDHILLRKSVATTINNFDNCRVVLQAANGKELQENLIPEDLPDLILLDINMPVMDGYETATWLESKCPGVRVLVLTMYDSELAMIRMLQLGVRGFLKKDIEPTDLLNAIVTTMKTGYYYQAKLVNLLQSGTTNIPLVNNIILTPVELRFLILACSGRTYKEIAMEMGPISPKTLDHYREALFAKLNLKNRVELAIYALENGVVRKKDE